MTQGYNQADFVVTPTKDITSWQLMVATLIALTEPMVIPEDGKTL